MGAVGFSAGAWAQDTPAQSAPAPSAAAQQGAGSNSLFSQRSQLEEVTVQAQKREESQQSVPVAITALTGLALERKFATTLEDVNHAIPNVDLSHVGLFAHASSFNIRGISTSGIESYADPAVAVFVDGVYQARNAWEVSNVLDVDAIEVMRGPQGTIYGRNAFAGAISVRTKNPDMEEESLTTSLEISNGSRFVISAIGNVPLVQDKVAFRLASQFLSFGGYFKNDGVIVDSPVGQPVATHIDENLQGKRLGGDEYVYFRPSLRFTPNDNLDIVLKSEIIRERGDGSPSSAGLYDPRTPSNANCGASLVGTPAAFFCDTSTAEVLYPTNGLGRDPFGDALAGKKADGSNPYRVGRGSQPQDMTNFDSYNFTLNADYHTSIGTFTLTTNYLHQDNEIWSDVDGTNTDLWVSARWETYKTYQGELHFVSDFSDVVTLTTGLFYLWDKFHVGQLIMTPGIGPFTPDNPKASYGNNGQSRKTWAAYAQAEVHITPELSAVAGGRYSWEKKYNVFGHPIVSLGSQGIPAGTDLGSYPVGPGTLTFGPTSDSWDSFSPRLGLNFQATDDVLLFGFWQRAYESGGFVTNAATVTTFSTPFGQERVDNFEIGAKTDWFDNRLRVNVNAYYAKFNGLQRQIIRPANVGTGQETYTTNAADARSYGVELEVMAIPVEGLTLSGNIGYNNIKYTSFCADLDGPETTPVPASGRAVCGDVTLTPSGYIVDADYSDLRLPFAPRLTGMIGFTYDFAPTSIGNFSIASSFNYSSKMSVVAQNTPYGDRKPLTTVDASINWEAPNGKYRVSVWGRNLNNDIERLSTTGISAVLRYEQPTLPRTYGITLTADF
jgi:iron complex outermembrane receptor protein